MTGLKVEEVNVHVQGVNTNMVNKEESEQSEENEAFDEDKKEN